MKKYSWDETEKLIIKIFEITFAIIFGSLFLFACVVIALII